MTVSSTTARIIFCGGRFSAEHAAIHVACSGAKFKSLILTDISKFGNIELPAEVLEENLDLINTGTDAVSIPQKIYNAKKDLLAYDKVVLCGVDDLIPDESLNTIDNCMIKDDQSIALNFGIDLSYYPKSKGRSGEFFAMPRYLIPQAKVLTQEEYWSRVSSIISQDNPRDRINEFYTEISMFPFVYSVYNTKQLIKFCTAFLATLHQCCVEPSSGFAAILFEFLIITTSLAMSTIGFTNKIFRLNNYSSCSAGSDPYNYRTCLSSLDELTRVNHFIDIFASIFLYDNNKNRDHLSSLLRSGYLLASVQSNSMLHLTQKSGALLMPKSHYQEESLKYFRDKISSDEQLAKMTNMVANWNE